MLHLIGSVPARLSAPPAFVVMCHVLDPDTFQIATCQPRLLLPPSFPLPVPNSPPVHLPATLEICPLNVVIRIVTPPLKSVVKKNAVWQFGNIWDEKDCGAVAEGLNREMDGSASSQFLSLVELPLRNFSNCKVSAPPLSLSVSLSDRLFY